MKMKAAPKSKPVRSKAISRAMVVSPAERAFDEIVELIDLYWRMRKCFVAYRDDPKLSPLLRVLPWSSHLHILSRTKRPEEREFYLREQAKGNGSGGKAKADFAWVQLFARIANTYHAWHGKKEAGEYADVPAVAAKLDAAIAANLKELGYGG